MPHIMLTVEITSIKCKLKGIKDETAQESCRYQLETLNIFNRQLFILCAGQGYKYLPTNEKNNCEQILQVSDSMLMAKSLCLELKLRETSTRTRSHTVCDILNEIKLILTYLSSKARLKLLRKNKPETLINHFRFQQVYRILRSCYSRHYDTFKSKIHLSKTLSAK